MWKLFLLSGEQFFKNFYIDSMVNKNSVLLNRKAMRKIYLPKPELSAPKLAKIKAILEKANGRELSDEQVLETYEFVCKLAEIAVDQATKDAEWEAKLDKNPGGYAFELKGYTCRLCGDGGSDDGMWYDRFGLKCMHCQKAVESGLIPGKLTGDRESFYTDYDLEHFFNVGSKALTLWLRHGIIKARIIPRAGKPSVKHKRVFLMIDNVGFLPPKEMLRFSDVAFEEVEGERYEHHLKWYQCCDPFEYLKDFRIMQYLRPTDPANPPTQQTLRRASPKKTYCNQTTFPRSFVNKRHATKTKAKRK